MAQRIVYPTESGVAVVIPATEFADQIAAVAEKDVPPGVPWRIVDDADLPPREVRDKWVWTEAGPLGVAE